MKTLMMLMLASSFVTVPAFAVGRDTSAPNCQQVIQAIQEQLKKSRPVVDNANTGTPDTVAPAGTAK